MSSNIPTVVPATMTSREIAELTGKTHAHVLRDIDSLLESLNPDLVSGFKSSTYADTTGKENRMFVMDRDSSYCLVAGYDANARMRIIKRWQELETQAVLPTAKQPNNTTIRAERELQALARDTMRTLKVFGIVGNAAVISTDNYCRTIAGRSLLAPLGATHLLADQRGKTYTPTELGKRLNPPLSAVKLNLLLESSGLQKRDMGEWMPSDKATDLMEWLDTGKRHSNGTPVKQIKWFAAVLDVVKPQMKEAA